LGSERRVTKLKNLILPSEADFREALCLEKLNLYFNFKKWVFCIDWKSNPLKTGII
jgi:hypothetical protein